MTVSNTLILGIGNILRKDDGAGIQVIDRLREKTLPGELLCSTAEPRGSIF